MRAWLLGGAGRAAIVPCREGRVNGKLPESLVDPDEGFESPPPGYDALWFPFPAKVGTDR